MSTSTSNATTLWKYYQKCYDTDTGQFLEKVQCVICWKRLTYRSSHNFGALWRHLKIKHSVINPSSENKITKETVTDLPKSEIRHEVQDGTGSGAILRYFSFSNRGFAKCRICVSASLPTPKIPNRAVDLKRHLQTHPRAYKLYELERDFGTKGPHYMESNEKNPKTSKIEEEIYVEVIHVGGRDKKSFDTILKTNTRPAEEVNLKEKTKGGKDDLERFGLYIASLLRNMPKNDCIKTQKEIINHIIEVQLSVSDRNLDSTEVTEEIIVPVQHEEATVQVCEEETIVSDAEQDRDLSEEVLVAQDCSDVIEADGSGQEAESNEVELPSRKRHNQEARSQEIARHFRKLKQMHSSREETEAYKRYKYTITKDINILELQ